MSATLGARPFAGPRDKFKPAVLTWNANKIKAVGPQRPRSASLRLQDFAEPLNVSAEPVSKE